MTYTPIPQTLVGVPTIDDRGRVNLKKWLEPEATYHAHRFEDGTIVLVAA